MKTIAICTCVALAGGAMLLQGKEPAMTTKKWVGAKAQRSDITFVVWIEQGVPWKEMSASLEITNTSAKEVKYGYSAELRGFRLSMTDKESKSIDLTDRAKDLLKSDEITKYSHHKLEPGKSLKYDVKLSEFFVLTKTGEYKLSAAWEKDPLYRANNLKIELKDIAFVVNDL